MRRYMLLILPIHMFARHAPLSLPLHAELPPYATFSRHACLRSLPLIFAADMILSSRAIRAAMPLLLIEASLLMLMMSAIILQLAAAAIHHFQLFLHKITPPTITYGAPRYCLLMLMPLSLRHFLHTPVADTRELLLITDYFFCLLLIRPHAASHATPLICPPLMLLYTPPLALFFCC